MTKIDLSKGSFCYGESHIGYVDIMVAPFMIRNICLEKCRGFKVKENLKEIDLEKYLKWENAIMTDESVKATLQDDQLILKVHITPVKILISTI